MTRTGYWHKGQTAEEISERLKAITAPTMHELKIEANKLQAQLDETEMGPRGFRPVEMESPRLTEIARRLEGASQSDPRTRAKNWEERSKAGMEYRANELKKAEVPQVDWERRTQATLNGMHVDTKITAKPFGQYGYNRVPRWAEMMGGAQ